MNKELNFEDYEDYFDDEFIDEDLLDNDILEVLKSSIHSSFEDFGIDQNDFEEDENENEDDYEEL